MKKHSVSFFEVSAWEKEKLKRASSENLKNLKLLQSEEPLKMPVLSAWASCDVLSVFIYSRITDEVLPHFPQLRLIATRSTGYDHIDVAACARRGITVCNVPTYGENTVAEHTFALIFSLSRNVHKAYVRTVSGKFNFDGLCGFDLRGKTLGVIGTGNIGLHVIKITKGIGMRVLAYDVVQKSFLSEVLSYDYAPFEQVLSESDIVTLHVPYNESTHHLVNKENIVKIKKGALLINTSRGGLVDTEALLFALEKGILSGAGLDVLEGEDLIREEQEILSKTFSEKKLKTLVQNHVLMKRDDVVITPHIGFYSEEALQRILNVTMDNIKSFLDGKPKNVVAAG